MSYPPDDVNPELNLNLNVNAVDLDPADLEAQNMIDLNEPSSSNRRRRTTSTELRQARSRPSRPAPPPPLPGTPIIALPDMEMIHHGTSNGGGGGGGGGGGVPRSPPATSSFRRRSARGGGVSSLPVAIGSDSSNPQSSSTPQREQHGGSSTVKKTWASSHEEPSRSSSKPVHLRALLRKQRRAAREVAANEHFWCGQHNAMLAVLVVLFLVATGVLAAIAVRDREVSRRDHANDTFERTMNAYALSLESMVTGIDADMRVWGAFMQHKRSQASFTQAFTAMKSDLPAYVWARYVRHADRARLEKEMWTEQSTYLNNTALPRNISRIAVSGDGTVSTVEVSPPSSEYFAIFYAAPESLLRTSLLRDMNSDTVRGEVFNRSRVNRDVALSPRTPLNSGTLVGLSQISAMVVFDPDNSSEVLGVVVGGLIWDRLVVSALGGQVPSAARVRIYDVTGDPLDWVGCRFGIVFDGELSETGEWELTSGGDLFDAPCHTSQESIERDAPSGATLREITIADHKLLFVLSKSDKFSADVEINASLLASAVVLGFIVLVLLVGVAVRGWKLIQDLTVAQRDAHQEAVHTASAEFETRKALEQRDEFIAFMSHELRTPLFSILGTIDEVMDKDGEHSLPQETANDMISSSAEQMVATLNSVLSVQNVTRGTVEVQQHPLSLDALVKGACSDEAVNAEAKNIQIQYKWDERLPSIVYGDPHMLGTIVQHLVSNAVEYTQPGGDVCVSVYRECVGMSLDVKLMRMSQERSKFQVPRSVVFSSEFDAKHTDDGVTPDGVTVRLTVRDTGIGIDRKRLHTIFEPFSRERLAASNRKRGHSELGLPTVKALVTRLGGVVDVTSKLGEGSDFVAVLFLPTEEPPLPSTPQHKTRRRPRLNHDEFGDVASSRGSSTHDVTPALVRRQLAGRKVLVVEDDDTNRYIIRTMLNKELPDTEVVEACDGEQALSLIEETRASGESFAFCFLDIMLPGKLNGVEVAAIVRSPPLRISTPMFACTGGSTQEERKKYLAVGMSDVLCKPFSRSQMMNMLARHWGVISLHL